MRAQISVLCRRPKQAKPATQWEAEIDGLMAKQLVTRQYAERKRLFDRVQEIAMQNLPVIPLVSPHVLVGAKKGIGNSRSWPTAWWKLRPARRRKRVISRGLNHQMAQWQIL